MENVKITLKKSLIAAKPNQKLTAQSLGLKKIGDTIVLADDAATQGKVRVLAHLVCVDKAD